MVYYGNQRQLEYDFIVAPGSDPDSIRLGFEGAETMEIDAQGDLVLQTAGGTVRMHKPFVYQEVNGERIEVEGAFRTLNPQLAVGFEVSEYDATRPLVIDPTLSYSTYFGGGDSETATSIAVDAAGNAYVTGQTGSTDLPTVNPSQPSFGGGNNVMDAYVVKLNAAGSAILYSTYLGGSGNDTPRSITVDPAGNAYLTGITNSTNFPTANALQPASGGGNDAFVTKLNAAGMLVFSTYVGGSAIDDGYDIVVDSAGNIYVGGDVSSTNFPTKNPLQAANGGGAFDDFLIKMTGDGSALVYSTYLGGNGTELGVSIAVDGSGNVYMAGRTASTNFPTVNALQPASGGGQDAFVLKMNAAGSALLFSTYLGGSGTDQAEVSNGLAIDAAGNVYVIGQTASTNFPTAIAVQKDSGGGTDAFVLKMNPAGSMLVYSTYLGGSGNDTGRGIAVDATGSAYVTGQTSSMNFPTTNPVQAKFAASTSDAFVGKLNATGSVFSYCTYLGGRGSENGTAIAVDAAGNAYVTGQTGAPDFPTANALQSARRGDFDAFITKIAP